MKNECDKKLKFPLILPPTMAMEKLQKNLF